MSHPATCKIVALRIFNHGSSWDGWPTPHRDRFAHCTGAWVGPRARLDEGGEEKMSMVHWWNDTNRETLTESLNVHFFVPYGV